MRLENDVQEQARLAGDKLELICFPGSTFNISRDKKALVKLELPSEVVTMTRKEAAQVLRLFRLRLRVLGA